VKNKKEIPQADDVNKISEFPLGKFLRDMIYSRVSKGYDTADKIKHADDWVNQDVSVRSLVVL
jgi:hypothetical protein